MIKGERVKNPKMENLFFSFFFFCIVCFVIFTLRVKKNGIRRREKGGEERKRERGRKREKEREGERKGTFAKWPPLERPVPTAVAPEEIAPVTLLVVPCIFFDLCTSCSVFLLSS